MTKEIISLRVGRDIKERMRAQRHVNWSEVIRRALNQELDKMHKIDRKKALEALSDAKKIMKSGIFAHGRTGAEIIREWRDKRK